MGPCKTHDYKGSIPWSSTKFIPGQCSGNTTDFDSAIVSSILTPGARYRSVTQWIRVLVFETRGWEFESLRAGHIKGDCYENNDICK